MYKNDGYVRQYSESFKLNYRNHRKKSTIQAVIEIRKKRN